MKTRLLLLTMIAFLACPSWVSGQDTPSGRSIPVKMGVREKLPLIATHWSEGCFYNAGGPVDTASHSTCFHVPAGSGAVAMAQIMKFYRFPAHGTGEHGYPQPPYGIQYANFGNTNYTWDSMPDSLTSANSMLSTLIYQCAVAQNMAFGSVRSSSQVPDVDTALVKYFGYPNTATWKSRSDYSDSVWIAMLKSELDASHPLIFTATGNPGSIQQYFICDGYQGNDYFHFNMGEGGVHNGYFYLDNLKPDSIDFSNGQQALFNLAPQVPVSGSYTMDFESVSDFSLNFNDWSVNDADLHNTYGISGYTFLHQTQPMAFLCFNPASVTPSLSADQAMQPHGGQRFGACFSSNPPSNNDWFISPAIQLGKNGTFSFWVKSYNDLWGLDTYTVAVSVTDKNPASFTTISGTQPLQTTTSWVKKTFSLSAYNNQHVYVAIHCVSNDHFLMMIDDLDIKPQASATVVADFAADKTSLRVGETVNFTDQTTGAPTSWEWKFPGSMQGTLNMQNPVGIRYSTPGTYLVNLRVSNGLASDSVTKAGYIKVAGYPTTLSMDFESVSDFSLTFNPWMVIDVKGGNTYGIQSVSFPNNYLPMAYICFNPSQTTPPLENMTAHSGQKLGCSFSSVPPLNPNDKWLITPKVSLGLNPQIQFWVQTYNSSFGFEKYYVAVSTTGQNPADFIRLNAQPESAPVDWTLKTYSLSDYSNQDVYIAIQCVTNDGFIFMLDDISVTSSLGLHDVNSLERVVVCPNPANDYLNISFPANSAVPAEIGMISAMGEQIRSWRVIPVGGKVLLDVRQIPQGVYVLRIIQDGKEVTRKVSILN
jgi:PKD repeat protein